MKDEVMKYLTNTLSSSLPDQDALNVIYKGGIYFIDQSWNFFSTHVHRSNEKTLKRKIYHYAGTQFRLYYENEMDMLYLETI